MAEPLKNQFGADKPATIAGMIANVYPPFDVDAFLADALAGYEALDLTPRGRQIAVALRTHLPADYEEAVDILIASLGPKLASTESFGMAPFLYLPHVTFVATYGVDHFESSMRAQYELTQRFSAEFSIRAFLIAHPEATLARLRAWVDDPSPHVRRLVSEGTRPRLPWAQRLPAFQQDPRPVLALLERLKDDPELYVRRSVANNLNDIGKDHPALLVDTARRWMADASEQRAWVVRHALRSAVKRGDPEALSIIGFDGAAEVRIENARMEPEAPAIGETAYVAFDLIHAGADAQRILVDYCVHYVKANGKTSPKVFKLKTFELTPGERTAVRKALSLTQ
ncbi:MAG: DNA alkylation repair protein [Rhodothermales bacterium]